MQRHTKVAIGFFIALLLYGGIKYLPAAYQHMHGAVSQHQVELSKV